VVDAKYKAERPGRTLDLGLGPAALLRQVDQLAVRVAKTDVFADGED
jgi:hypothetical protein